MPAFWKSSVARADHPAGPVDAVPPWTAGAELHSDDWAAIEGLLDAGTAVGAGPGPSGPDPRTTLLDALADLRAGLDHPVLPAGRISDRLLDIWDLAHQVDPAAAAPAASLMTALLKRDLASAAEVAATCDEIEQLVAATPAGAASAA
jgi:hypothetical protein